MVAKKGSKKDGKSASKRKPAFTPKKSVPPVPQPDTSWHEAFLRSMAAFPNVRLAARQCGITPRDAYKHRDLFPEFAALWDEVKEQGIDALELKAFNRASKASDTLAIFFLKAHRPDIYRDKLEMAFDLSGLTDEEILKLNEIRAKLNSKS